MFVGVDVGEAMRREASRVVATIGAALTAAATPPRVVWVSPGDLHVTLRFIGEVDAEAAAALTRRFEAPIPMARFDVEWRGLGAFPSPRRPRALWMGLAAGADNLGRLESEVARLLDGQVADEPRPFRPHVTLGRVKTDGAGVDWPGILNDTMVRGARSIVDHVTLYQSHGSPRGSHYTELARAWLGEPTAGERSANGGPE